MDNLKDIITDHEAILLLRQDVKAIKESQDIFHKEVKEAFKDLQNNYSSRLDSIETRCTKIENTSDTFSLVKTLVFSFIGMILVSVASALIYLVVKH